MRSGRVGPAVWIGLGVAAVFVLGAAVGWAVGLGGRPPARALIDAR